jgi:prophage regulatory protein
MGGVLQVGGKEHMFDQRFKSDRPGIKAPAPARNAPATTEFGTHATTTVAIVDEAKVHELTSLSRTTRWRMERRGEFPKRVRLSAGRVGWRQADIEEWIRSRTA